MELLGFYPPLSDWVASGKRLSCFRIEPRLANAFYQVVRHEVVKGRERWEGNELPIYYHYTLVANLGAHRRGNTAIPCFPSAHFPEMRPDSLYLHCGYPSAIGRTVALFEFLAAPAGAWLIWPSFRHDTGDGRPLPITQRMTKLNLDQGSWTSVQ